MKAVIPSGGERCRAANSVKSAYKGGLGALGYKPHDGSFEQPKNKRIGSRLIREVSLAASLLLAPAAFAGDTHLLVVSGIGGEATYSDLFHNWSLEMLDGAENALGIARERITYLAEDPQRAPDRIATLSRKEDLGRAISGIAERAAANDLVMVLLIGHGTADAREARFNLPGPDINAKELDEMLDNLAEQTVVVVNTTPSSGPFTRALSAPKRVVITATQGARENNHTIFARHFIAALSGDGADTDKDGRISMLEAFAYAKREVQREYESDHRLLTEHAVLDDNGDGEASLTPSANAADGVLAATLSLETATLAAAGAGEANEALAALHARRDELEQRIATLKQHKADLDPDIYERRLEDLLIELALNRRAIGEAQAEQ